MEIYLSAKLQLSIEQIICLRHTYLKEVLDTLEATWNIA